jgi:hypothetical protein
MHEFAGLLFDGSGDRRVRVPKRADGDAGDAVEVLALLRVDERAAVTLYDRDRRRRVRFEQRVRGHVR